MGLVVLFLLKKELVTLGMVSSTFQTDFILCLGWPPIGRLANRTTGLKRTTRRLWNRRVIHKPIHSLYFAKEPRPRLFFPDLLPSFVVVLWWFFAVHSQAYKPPQKTTQRLNTWPLAKRTRYRRPGQFQESGLPDDLAGLALPHGAVPRSVLGIFFFPGVFFFWWGVGLFWLDLFVCFDGCFCLFFWVIWTVWLGDAGISVDLRWIFGVFGWPKNNQNLWKPSKPFLPFAKGCCLKRGAFEGSLIHKIHPKRLKRLTNWAQAWLALAQGKLGCLWRGTAGWRWGHDCSGVLPDIQTFRRGTLGWLFGI